MTGDNAQCADRKMCTFGLTNHLTNLMTMKEITTMPKPITAPPPGKEKDKLEAAMKAAAAEMFQLLKDLNQFAPLTHNQRAAIVAIIRKVES